MGNVLLGYALGFLASKEGQEITAKVVKKVFQNIEKAYPETTKETDEKAGDENAS